MSGCTGKGVVLGGFGKQYVVQQTVKLILMRYKCAGLADSATNNENYQIER